MLYKGYIKNAGGGGSIRCLVEVEDYNGKQCKSIFTTHGLGGWTTLFSEDRVVLFPKPVQEEHPDWAWDDWYEKLWQDDSWSWMFSQKLLYGPFGNAYWKICGGNKWKRRFAELRGRHITNEEFRNLAQEAV